MADYTIHHGDSLLVLPTLEADSIDACVTDPPYELGFMGKAWDRSGIAYNVDLWREVLRVMKPGAHLLAFGGTRTYHRMACAIEDAGFEIRDQIQWIYGSGFPKSLDVSKAIDKEAGAERERVPNPLATKQTRSVGTTTFGDYDGVTTISPLPATESAKQWNGFGTALKPANEPICLARKPLEKGLTVAQNVLKWGTGALNIDGCRIETSDGYADNAVTQGINTAQTSYEPRRERRTLEPSNQGRFPANVIHDGSDEVEAGFPQNAGAAAPIKGTEKSVPAKGDVVYGFRDRVAATFHNDSGSASRFFYCAKTAGHERNRNGADNNHPTVKPASLMQYLCRLITPPGGTVLDPFNGSGSTGLAAIAEGFNYVGIELNPEYIEITEKRLRNVQVNLF